MIALLTALLVVGLSVDGPLAGVARIVPWVLPTLVGVPALELWRRSLVAATPGASMTSRPTPP